MPLQLLIIYLPDLKIHLADFSKLTEQETSTSMACSDTEASLLYGGQER
jgi:hypothetical protein